MISRFTIVERQNFLDIYFRDLERWRELDFSAIAEADVNKNDFPEEMEKLQRKLSNMREYYEKHLPILPLSRCPFTNEFVMHSIDPFGIDGLWWNYNAPVRPVESLPRTYFALAGALSIRGKVGNAPFLCKPGPEVPYVIPRILDYSEIKAVISSIKIGPHQAFPIFYFADPIPNIRRINTWGTNQYTIMDENGVLGWNAVEENLEDYDFELEKWIENGKLLWIDSADKSMSLNSDVFSCPYIELSGRREILRIERGKIWS
jgi:hypothetical protein